MTLLIVLLCAKPSLGYELWFGPPSIPTGEWHHYAMVKSGTSFQWYVDGVAQRLVTINYNETTPLPFFIGGEPRSGDRMGGCFAGVRRN